MANPEEILKQYWGYDSFRPLQLDIINSVLAGKDVLALLPTGGGKSLCFQVPALMMDGFCLVISPLIALMQDQVARLKDLGIAAECIYSGMKYTEVKRVLDNAMRNECKLLYISPERLQTRLFRDYMTEFDVSMIAVDEAHCISQWGHDFRPEYLKITAARDVYPKAPVLALTATATIEVQADIQQQLKMRAPTLYKQSFARNNIFYDIRYSENKNGDTLGNADTRCSIIYCRSRKLTDTMSEYLQQMGVRAAAYHAGMAKDKREEAQRAWMTNTAAVMVATTAFGMGIDKGDVRMVLHCDAPEHLEAYYQEAGRAGRDGAPSVALTLFNTGDLNRLRESTALQYPPEAYLRQVYQAVVEYLQIPIGTEPDQYYDFDLADFSKKFKLIPTHAIYALKLLEQEGLWTLSESVYHPATIQFVADRHVLDRLSQAHPDLAYVCVGLSRMYNTIFYYPTPVRESAIGRHLNMKRDELMPRLERLARMGILEYNKPGEGPQLFFHHYRVDSRHLIINLKRIGVLRKRHEARTEAMIGFLQNTTECRERLILSYFGESPKANCGHCDICKRRMSVIDAVEIKCTILHNYTGKGWIAIHEIASVFPIWMRGEVMAVIREMLDSGLAQHNDGFCIFNSN